MSVLFGFWLARPVTASAPQPITENYISENLTIKENAIQPILPKPVGSDAPQSTRIRTDVRRVAYSGRHYSKEEVVQLIKDYSARYGISENLPLAIARCESGFNQFSKNKTSTASGVYQYLSATWASTDEGKAGLSVFDADANVRAAIKYIASRGHAAPWNASKHCWG